VLAAVDDREGLVQRAGGGMQTACVVVERVVQPAGDVAFVASKPAAAIVAASTRMNLARPGKKTTPAAAGRIRTSSKAIPSGCVQTNRARSSMLEAACATSRR
jgi:hypothetical protein